MTRIAPLTLCCILMLAACTDAESPRQSLLASDTQSWPGEDWQLSTPEQEGLDGQAITLLDREFRSGQHGYVDSMLIIRNGRMVFEAYYEYDYQKINAPLISNQPGPWNYYDIKWHPYYQGSELHTVQSSTKSVMSALVGIAINRGDLPATSAVLGELLPHRNINDPQKAAITLDSVLTMRSGFEWEEDVSYWDPSNDAIRVESSDDWVAYLLNKPMSHDQGTTYKYNSTNTQLMSEIVSTATGQALDDYANQLLFKPIGIKKYIWKDAPEGFKDVAGGLYFTAQDFARFALLYETEGLWNDKQVIPSEWVTRSIHPHIKDTFPDDPGFNVGYGYQWWIYNDGTDGGPVMYGSGGGGGQFALIVPELNLIGVFTGWNVYEGLDYQYAYSLFYNRIVLPTGRSTGNPAIVSGT